MVMIADEGPGGTASSTTGKPLSSRGGLLALWLLVLLTPLAVVPDAVDGFTIPKLVLGQTLGLLSLALLAPAILAGLAARPGLRQRLAWGLLPLLGVATLGWAFTGNPLHVARALGELWVGVACLAGWALALPAARLRRLLDALALPAAALAGLVALQFHGLFQPFRFQPLRFGAEAHGARLELSSLAGNPADLAAFLVLPCLLAQVGLARGPGRRRWWWGLVLALCLYGMAVTQTVTAFVALGGATVLLWALHRPLPAARRLLVAALALAILALSLIAPLRARIVGLGGQIAAGEIHEALSGRLDGWRAALWMARQQPLTGVGHGSYRATFAEARLALKSAGVDLYDHHELPAFANAHNELLEVAAEWGAPGLLALGLALWMLLAPLVRLRRVPPGPQREAFALAWAGMSAWLLLSLAHFPFRLALTGFPALLFLAWALRLGDEEAE